MIFNFNYLLDIIISLDNSLNFKEPSDIINLPCTKGENKNQLENKPIKNFHVCSIINYKK